MDEIRVFGKPKEKFPPQQQSSIMSLPVGSSCKLTTRQAALPPTTFLGARRLQAEMEKPRPRVT